MLTVVLHKHYKGKRLDYTIHEVDNRFIVLKGTIIKEWHSSSLPSLEVKKASLFVDSNGVLNKDISFTSLSTASGFIIGFPSDIKSRFINSYDFCAKNSDMGKRYIEAINLKSCTALVDLKEDKQVSNVANEDFTNKCDSDEYSLDKINSYSLEECHKMVEEYLKPLLGIVNCKAIDVIIRGSSEATLKGILEQLPSTLSESIKSDLKSIIDNCFSKLESNKNGIVFQEPTAQRLVIVEKGSNEYNEAISNLNKILNPADIETVVDELKLGSVFLQGSAGIGKGFIAENIGARLIDEGYGSYAKLVFNCSSASNPNEATWGTGMNNVEILGATYTACRYASDNPNTAVVLIFDEILKSDWEKLIGKAMELFSDKKRHTYAVMNNGKTIRYESNLFVIFTGNVGSGFKQGGIMDASFNDRVTYVTLTGLFNSSDSVERYIQNMCVPSDYADVLRDIYAQVSENGKVSSYISLRNLEKRITSCKDVDTFRDEVYKLFSSKDRKSLGWE